MGNPERPQESVGAQQETSPAKIEKTHTDPQELWRALQAELDRRPLTQTALAGLAGVHATEVSATLTTLLDGNWPTRPAEQKTLAKIAEKLGISYSAPAVVEKPHTYRSRGIMSRTVRAKDKADRANTVPAANGTI